MLQCIIVNPMPVSLDESRDQEQQGTLWLMEIGYHLFHNLIGISGSDNNLCAGVKCIQLISRHIIHDIL